MARSENYQTRQKEAIFNFMMSLKGGHVTVAQIMEHFIQTGIPIGKTTIYRHLERLEQDGMVRKYMIEGITSACYQYLDESQECQEHYHLKCEQCGQLIHLECEYLNTIKAHIENQHHFHLNAGKTIFYGCCEQCYHHR